MPAENYESRLDCTRHGGHEYEIRLSWRTHVACLLGSDFSQRRISVGVAMVNAACLTSN
jgi:hypothetical protein